MMDFHEKLQDLRKQKGLTQQELADQLYVSAPPFPSGNRAGAIPASIR